MMHACCGHVREIPELGFAELCVNGVTLLRRGPGDGRGNESNGETFISVKCDGCRNDGHVEGTNCSMTCKTVIVYPTLERSTYLQSCFFGIQF